MKRILLSMTAAFVLSLSILSPASAKSACSGLSSSACSVKSNMCTWRKSSVDKNGKKTKAHCRALPGKAKKASAKTKSSKSKSTSASKKSASKKSSDVKSSKTKKKVSKKSSKSSDSSKKKKKSKS